MKLTDPITILPKIGPSLQKKFEKIGIITIKDMLYHFPFRYEDSSNSIKISELVNYVDKIVTIKAKVYAIDQFRTRYGKVLVNAKIYDDTGMIDVIWFNQPYVTSYLKKETEAIFYGKLTQKGKKISLAGPKYEVINENGTKFLGKISGVYSETYGLTSRLIKDKVASILEQLSYADLSNSIVIEDKLSLQIQNKYNLIDLISALRYIHLPNDFNEIEKARERLGFEEILEIQKIVMESKRLRQRLGSPQISQNENLLKHFIENSPFQPTNAQQRSVHEIMSDMEKGSPMNRLLEGDVGSGKTWVAAATALQTLKSGLDVAFLAPTSVLASQHSLSLIKMIEPYEIEVKLVTAGTKGLKTEEKDSNPIFFNKKHGTLYIGTHALLYDKNILQNLGLVIVDEQHRFGVKQREYLLELESENVKTGVKTTPHFLSMTATPIPRSMALTVFGDLDLSLLDELPKERIKIETYLVEEDKRSNCYEWCKQQLRDNNTNQLNLGKNTEVINQMFVICPLIEDSENLQAKSVLAEFEKIKKEFSDFKVELLHGKMKEKEKNLILERFDKKEFDILVATPVVEVGIDIKDATLILIESSERFGLAQLHQLRGRVGRSSKKSYCVLFSTGGNFSERLKFFSKTDLGIKLAEFDLSNRGPGEVYGTKQSGIPKLKIANIMDVELVKKAREALSL